MVPWFLSKYCKSLHLTFKSRRLWDKLTFQKQSINIQDCPVHVCTQYLEWFWMADNKLSSNKVGRDKKITATRFLQMRTCKWVFPVWDWKTVPSITDINQAGKQSRKYPFSAKWSGPLKVFRKSRKYPFSAKWEVFRNLIFPG